jgi:hypothetical protein
MLREKIFSHLLLILNLQPEKMVIQEGGARTQATMYTTPTSPILMTVLLETKQGKEEYISTDVPDRPIWENDVVELLRHHRPPVLETQLFPSI